MLKYGLNRVSQVFGLAPNIMEENLDMVSEWMVEAGKKTEYSPTFRKGAVGGWREYFTPAIIGLFKETDKNNWLERLGYGF